MRDANDDVVSKFNAALSDLAGRGAKVGREESGEGKRERERERGSEREDGLENKR